MSFDEERLDNHHECRREFHRQQEEITRLTAENERMNAVLNTQAGNTVQLGLMVIDAREAARWLNDFITLGGSMDDYVTDTARWPWLADADGPSEDHVAGLYDLTEIEPD